jgi:putative glutamine amidotransferase
MARSTPLVGVTTYYADAAWGPWHQPAAVVAAPYFELAAAAGGRPLLLPPCRAAPGGPGAGAADVVDALDALVLVGGGDVDPVAYGQRGQPAAEGVDADRDRSEAALLVAALDRDLPLLAICRGHQLLNVQLGGTLFPHLPDVVGHDGHRPAAGQFGDVTVTTESGTWTARAMGAKAVVKCSHHQAIDRLGVGLVVAARALEPAHRLPDAPPMPHGMVEAVELPDRRFVVGVQWHPEESGDGRLFDALVAAAR